MQWPMEIDLRMHSIHQQFYKKFDFQLNLIKITEIFYRYYRLLNRKFHLFLLIHFLRFLRKFEFHLNCFYFEDL